MHFRLQLVVDQRLSPRSVRRHLHHVAQRLEDDLGDEVGMIGGPQAAMPAPDDRPPFCPGLQLDRKSVV